jgi:hypothetical protein
LKEHQAGVSAAELCRKRGISDATIYKWRSKYGGMEVPTGHRSGNHGPDGPKAGHALTFKFDHLNGADHEHDPKNS